MVVFLITVLAVFILFIVLIFSGIINNHNETKQE